MTASSEQQARLDLALTIAWEAGRLTLNYFQDAQLQVERKADQSPVTVADREAERLLRRHIEGRFSDDAIVGEEFGETTGRSGYRWILDPIDGTKSFISGVPLYGTMVGVEVDQQSVLGVVYIPGLDEGVYALRGQGSWYRRGNAEARAARVSSKKQLEQGLFVTSQLDTFGRRGAEDAYRQLERRAYITRTWGDCYGYLLVATGRAELMVDPLLNVWDAAAIQPILEEAGGTFTDWRGNRTIHAGEGIGTNGHILDEVLSITRSFPPRTDDR